MLSSWLLFVKYDILNCAKLESYFDSDCAIAEFSRVYPG
jgi:hypothetical protein